MDAANPTATTTLHQDVDLDALFARHVALNRNRPALRIGRLGAFRHLFLVVCFFFGIASGIATAYWCVRPTVPARVAKH